MTPSSTVTVRASRRTDFRQLHQAILEIVSAINRPQADVRLIREAKVAIDRALFPLLVGIRRFGPIGVVELADRAGRDYTTVSRQVATLRRLGLVVGRAKAGDRRVHESSVTPKGQAMTDRLDVARDHLLGGLFRDWSSDDVRQLVRLVSQFANALNGASGKGPAPRPRRRSPRVAGRERGRGTVSTAGSPTTFK